MAAKRLIAKKAAAFLADGQRVMLDGSSTASFLLPHIARQRGVELYTNSMLTALRAIELGIPTHCLGGRAVGSSAVLAGEAACEAVSVLRVDILFFSSLCLDGEGVISDPTLEENYLRRLMLQSAAGRIFLCDGEKFGRRSTYRLASLRDVDAAVFDRPWEEMREFCEIL